jgi:hypothetical protein
MGEHRIRISYACKACKATGLYVGLAERDGAAVVCHTCKGTGEAVHVFEYDDFSERQPRQGVRRVFEANPGIVIGEGNGHKLEDFGGMPYRRWTCGGTFSAGMENREFTCPAWWYQSADYSKKPSWDECGIGAFAGCQHFCDKAACWDRWDREFGNCGD